MKQTIVRINKIVLCNFKNVKKGIIEMPACSCKELFSEKADVLGIYGQNGSGKTAVIEALRFIKIILSGEILPAETKEFISQNETECTIDVIFSVSEENKKETVNYSVSLKKDAEDFVVSRECLSVIPRNDNAKAYESTLVDYHYDNENITFEPGYRYKKLVAKDKKTKIDLNIAQAISIKSHKSFIFGEDGYKIFSQCSNEVMGEYGELFSILLRYARLNLFVINNVHSGPISMKLILPVSFYLRDGENIATGELPIRIDGPSVITKEMFHLVQTVINGMNIVLKNVIPSLELEIHNFGEQLLNNGGSGYRIELLSKRGDIRIPLKYESEGIVKIISFLNVLICVYNSSSMCLVIDELDSGIFEYLLGELLTVFSNGGKGQLIFTSHNLRALEMLGKKNILFSTTNPENRYIRLKNVQTNNNLRDLYLRSLTLGGQKEEMYDETDSTEIGRAFRLAGNMENIHV